MGANITPTQQVDSLILPELNRHITPGHLRFIQNPRRSLFGQTGVEGQAQPAGQAAPGITMREDAFTAGGVVYKFQTDAPMNTIAGGVPDATTVVPKPWTGFRYQNVMYRKTHLPMVLTPAQVSDAVLEEIGDEGDQDGLNDLVRKIIAETMLDQQDIFSILQVVGRAGVLGTIVKATDLAGTQLSSDSAYATDNTAEAGMGLVDPVTGDAITGRFDFYLYIGVDGISPAFRKGRALSICAAPTYWGLSTYVGGGCGNVLNCYAAGGTGGSHTAIYVADSPERIALTSTDYTTSGAIFRVKCYCYYTAATDTETNDSVRDMISSITQNAIGTGNVVTLWCGDIATASTAVTQGKNHGRQGAMHWFQRANIETATGATAAASVLTNSEGTTISRLAGGNAEWWFPKLVEAGGAAITLDQILMAAENLAYSGYGELGQSLMPVASSWIIKSLCASAGGAGEFRKTINSWDKTLTERWQTWGYQGVVFQGPGIQPTAIAQNDWVPSNYALILKERMMNAISPGKPRWGLRPTNQQWYPCYNSGGDLVMNSQTFFHRRLQFNGNDLWNTAAVANCKP